MAEDYDLVILGGGTGGYVAAIKAAQEGLKTAIVEQGKLGGTCLHKGCIPSKALLRSAEVLRTAQEASEFGVNTSGVSFDFSKAQVRKQKVVDQLYKGVQFLMKRGDIDVYQGKGRLLGPSIFSPTPGTISVERENEENVMLIGKNVIVATGSSPRTLPGFTIDGTHVLTSDHALSLEYLPASILIVGGGVIGVEWASMLVDFGVDVTIVEYGERILPTEDQDIAQEAAKQLKARGIKIVTNVDLQSDQLTKEENSVQVTGLINGEQTSFKAEKLLVCVGRAGNTTDIGLQNTDIQEEHGFIQVNEFGQTKESHIYAIGDVVGGMQLAHVASHEGLLAVDHILGNDPVPIDPETVPSCIYSFPEIASVGLTEQQAKEKGLSVKVGTFSFQAIGKAIVQGDTNGFVKLIANQENDDLIGVHIIGPHATELISEAALAKVLDAASWEVARTIHPHPTLSEVLGEAALAANGKAIHG
ncbi:dihydrolipoyl dehydrogenase [Alkalicoccobacillus murimartini]|uniref:Dihydrolipoyl dehydrogenase n=1 Tax=Alkalicoccobacillus murimartini TaxID=171685 RepID=A0ABT9YNY8_9BACI|nr:dihydrolipoyl dehydrogenase [Alkalicoccobacillus murimartini]MDQ0208917.1 dihydrolipoamide dehydrogenase [Alkalicoccobacillus murimartini]